MESQVASEGKGLLFPGPAESESSSHSFTFCLWGPTLALHLLKKTQLASNQS